MFIDRPEHQTFLLSVLNLPGLSLTADPERSLEVVASEYLDVLNAVKNATVPAPASAE